MPDTVGAIVLAAGQGLRAGGAKQFQPLAGVPLFIHAVRAFAACESIARLVIVIPQDASADLMAREALDEAALGSRCDLVAGGRRRQDSVHNGLRALGACEWVVVHDSARPFVDRQMIEAGLLAVRATGAASIATPLSDTLKQAGRDMVVTHTLPREGLWTVQTPQVFRRTLLEEAHAQVSEDVTDDATMIERIDGRVTLYAGSSSNIKITTADDFRLAELMLASKRT